MSPDELRALADRVRYAATFLLRPGTPSIYWNACNRAADYLRLQAHTHPDRGGTDARMAEVNRAWEQAQEAVR